MADEPKKGLWANHGDTIAKLAQPILLIGGMIFTSGGVYGEVKDMKGQLSQVHESQIEQAAMSVEIKNLHDQIKESRETQKQTNDAVGKLADSVQQLSVNVARMEGKKK